MVWFLLIIAGLFETAWALGLKYTEGFTRLWPSVGTLIAMTASFLLLAHCMKTLPVGTAYAVWTGIRHCRYGRSGYFPVQRTAFMAKNSISSDDSGGHRRLEVAGVNPVVSDGQSSFARLMMEAC